MQVIYSNSPHLKHIEGGMPSTFRTPLPTMYVTIDVSTVKSRQRDRRRQLNKKLRKMFK